MQVIRQGHYQGSLHTDTHTHTHTHTHTLTHAYTYTNMAAFTSAIIYSAPWSQVISSDAPTGERRSEKDTVLKRQTTQLQGMFP